MFSESEKDKIRKRLSDLNDLGDRNQEERIELQQLFDEICGLNDTNKRKQKENIFQQKLIDIENHANYLRGRWKI